MSVQRSHINQRGSQIAIHQRTFYLAGQVAADEDFDSLVEMSVAAAI